MPLALCLGTLDHVFVSAVERVELADCDLWAACIRGDHSSLATNRFEGGRALSPTARRPRAGGETVV